MLLAQHGQWLRVHLSCEIHVGMSVMQLFSLVEESADGSVNVKFTLLRD